MRFKKGAFNSLLPIKPVMIRTTLYDKFHLSTGSGNLFEHFVRTLCFLYHDVEMTELPVIAPTKHMFDYYSKLHPELKEEWEIYSEVAREIYVSLGNFVKTEKTLRDTIEYGNICRGDKKSSRRDESAKSKFKINIFR